MARIHVGFKSKEEATNLHQELWGNQNVLKSSITAKKPQTGEYLVSIETSSNEIEEKIKNSGGRIISDEEYEALTAYSIGDLDNGWITDIQLNLASKGYYLPIYPSGIFDEETKYAVMAFQREHNLKVDGIVNETVMHKIREAGNRPSFLQTAQSLQLNGPRDWSTNLDRYLDETEINKTVGTEAECG